MSTNPLEFDSAIELSSWPDNSKELSPEIGEYTKRSTHFTLPSSVIIGKVYSFVSVVKIIQL